MVALGAEVAYRKVGLNAAAALDAAFVGRDRDPEVLITHGARA